MTSYEAGVKSSWFNNKLTFNANAFYQKHKDIQAAINPPGLPPGSPAFLPSGADRFFDNLGDGTTKGAEISVRSLPVKWLTIEGSYGYLHPTWNGDRER